MLIAATGTDDVARRLAGLLASMPREQVGCTPFVAGEPPARVVAIDGSNVTLAEGGSHLVGAYRVGRVDLAHGVSRTLATPPPRVVLLAARDTTALADALREAGAPGVELPRMDAPRILEHLRTLAELRAALDALDQMRTDDMLLLDGALQARPTLPLMDTLVQRARERGVDLVGACKSTSLTVGVAPALVACRLAARPLGQQPWHAEVPAPPSVRGRVLIARLSSAEPRPFRFDVVAADDDAPRALARLAALAGHPAYPGYPSPLAMAHNAALINEQERLRLRAHVHDAVVGAGVSEDDWNAAFLDYHDVLELGA